MKGVSTRDGEAALVLIGIALALLVWVCLAGCTIHLHLSERYMMPQPTTQPVDDNALTASYLAEQLGVLGVLSP